jgi:GAF domain-containing protein/DNA-binding CsgD family transcriptional regulator
MSEGCVEMSEPAGIGPGGSSGGRRYEMHRNRALLDLTLGLRRLDLSAFMREVARRAREVLGVEFCEVLELLADKDSVLPGAGEENLAGRVTVGPHTEHVALPLRDIVSGVSTLVCANGHLFGILGAYSTSRRRYTEEEVGFLQNAAELLGVAVERALSERSYRRALEKEKRRADAAEERYAFLREANVVLTTFPYGPAALVAVARLAVPALADWCFVELLEEDGTPRGSIRRLVAARSGETEERLARELTRRYALDPNAPHGTPKVLRTGRPELIPEVRDEVLRGLARDDEYLRWMRDLTPESYLCVPLQVGLRLVGSVGFISVDPARRYGAEDLILAESLARCTALVVANILEGSRLKKTIPSPVPDRKPGLTPRQLEVLRLLDSGMRVHQIKAELNLSEPTVRTHVRAILRAFGAGSQLEALHKARALGFVGGASAGGDRF